MRLSFDDAVFARTFSPSSHRLGALLGVPAFGALAGSAIVMAMGNPKRKGQLIIFVTLVYTAGLISFALSRSLILSLTIGFLLGLVDAVGETLRDTMIQLITPDPMRAGESFDQVFSPRAPIWAMPDRHGGKPFSASPAPWSWAAVLAPQECCSWPKFRARACARSMLNCQFG